MPIAEHTFHLQPLRGILDIRLADRRREEFNRLFNALRFDARSVLDRERNVLEQRVRVVGEAVGELGGRVSAVSAGERGLTLTRRYSTGKQGFALSLT